MIGAAGCVIRPGRTLARLAGGLALLVLAACAATPTEPSVTRGPTATLATTPLPPAATQTPDPAYGVAVTVLNACSDGTRTSLEIRTDLDLQYWGLSAADFSPLGDVYTETATAFLQDGRLFSSTSSGKRGDSVYNLLEHTAQTRQTFIYPAVPAPNAAFELRAEVALANLPADYRPPISGLAFAAPGLIMIPAAFTLPITVGPCR